MDSSPVDLPCIAPIRPCQQPRLISYKNYSHLLFMVSLVKTNKAPARKHYYMGNASEGFVSWLAGVLGVNLLEIADPNDEDEYIRQYNGDNIRVDGWVVAEDAASVLDLILDEIDEPEQLIEQIMDAYDIHTMEMLDPVRGVDSVRDDPDVLYVWKLDQDVPAQYISQLADRIEQVHGGQPKAFHMFARGMDDLKEYSHQDVEHELIPWLADAKAINGEVDT